MISKNVQRPLKTAKELELNQTDFKSLPKLQHSLSSLVYGFGVYIAGSLQLCLGPYPF
jgi:hypothetical protein